MKTVVSGQLSVVSHKPEGRARVLVMAVGVLALGMWVASCDNGGHGRHVFAQTAVYQSTMPLPSLVSAPGTFYSPETNLETLDVQALDAAHATVDFAAFSLTDQAIADELKALAGRGVRVRIYLDRGEVQSECRADVTCARIPLHALIGLAGVDIRVKRSKILMHLKSYEVDNFLVRDGSANFSIQGGSRQDNSATFSSDGAALTRFSRKFQAMWDRPDNLTVAQAVGSQAAP